MYVFRMHNMYMYFLLMLGIGKLIVLMKENNRVTEIWRKTGNQGRNWQKATIDIGRVDGAFQVCTFLWKYLNEQLSLYSKTKSYETKYFNSSFYQELCFKRLFLFSTLSS